MPVLDTSVTILALVAIGGYLVGSIPFGILVTRAMGLGDLRAIGSGNIGTTNVLRTGSKTAALLTLLLDAGKGTVAVLAARAASGEDAAQLAGLFAFAGHLFPVWLGFKGGKGVATFLGVMLAAAPVLGLIAAILWIGTAAVFRISSLSALVASAVTPLISLVTGQSEVFALSAALGLLVWVRHKDNILRLRAGTEPRIGATRKD